MLCRWVSGGWLVGLVMIMVWCSFFLLSVVLIKLCILWLCLLIRLIMIMLVVV